jgi:hypothetical protein
LRNSEQRRLLAKIPSARIQLRLKLAAMLLALFQRPKTNNEKQDQGANTDKNYNGDYANGPFKNGSSFHSPQMTTDRTPITSL